jgi:hypothetical protein
MSSAPVTIITTLTFFVMVSPTSSYYDTGTTVIVGPPSLDVCWHGCCYLSQNTFSSSFLFGLAKALLLDNPPPSRMADDASCAYMAERAFVESTLSDDDRQFDVGYLSYAYGCNTLAELYNPHEFDPETRTRFLRWIQSQVAAFMNAAPLPQVVPVAASEFWDDAFLLHHYVRAMMYTAWEVALLATKTEGKTEDTSTV